MEKTANSETISSEIRDYALKGVKSYCSTLIKKIEEDAEVNYENNGKFSKDVYETMPDIMNSIDLCEIVATYIIQETEETKKEHKADFKAYLIKDLALTIKRIKAAKKEYIEKHITAVAGVDFKFKMQLFINSVVKGVREYEESVEESITTEKMEPAFKKTYSSDALEIRTLNGLRM